MRREQTRYKGVWDAGYDDGMDDANRILEAALRAGVQFNMESRFDTDMVLVRIGDTIVSGSSEFPVQALDVLLSRARKPHSAESSASRDEETGPEEPVSRSASGGDGRIRTDE